MPARLSPRHALVALASAGALACGLSVSGLEDAADPGGGAPHPGSGGGPVTLVDSGPGQGVDSSASPNATVDSSLAPGSEDAESDDVLVLNPDASYAEAGDPCDLDGDGHRAEGTCGGDDCCDYDSRAHPGETAYYPSPDACGSFDFDCNGQNEPEYGTANCQLGFFTCNGDGFDGTPPACGMEGTFDACQYDVIYCGTSQSTAVQPCR